MRKAQSNPVSRTRLLDAAQNLIMRKGFSSTSVDEICRAAKLTKGTFFHYFKSKEELGKTVLTRFCCDSQEAIKEHCCSWDSGKKADPLQKVYSHLDGAIAMAKSPTNNKGCLLGMLAQEMSDTCPSIRELCVRGFDAWVKMFKHDLDAAKSRYAPKAAFDTQGLAEYFVAVVEGTQILTKAKPDRKLMEKNMQHFKEYLKNLFKK